MCPRQRCVFICLLFVDVPRLMAMSTSSTGKAREQFQKAIAVDNSCVQAYDSLASLELQA